MHYFENLSMTNLTAKSSPPTTDSDEEGLNDQDQVEVKADPLDLDHLNLHRPQLIVMKKV